MIKRRPARRPATRRPAFKSQFAERNRFRRLGHETLEKRELLAGDLLAIRPDNSGLLQDGDVLNVAPREFNLFFHGGANLNEATINANTVRLVRSGGDGVFGNDDDVAVALGYVGLVNPGTSDPLERQQIVIRPASGASHNAAEPAFAFPDDYYKIELIGAGTPSLASVGGEAFAGGEDFSIEFRLDRGAQVVSVVPQPVSRNAGGGLQQAANEIVVYFDDQTLNVNDATDPKFFRLVNTGATLTTADDYTLLPELADYDVDNNRVTLTFAEAIPEGTYRLDVGLSDGGSETMENAIRVGSLFDENRFTHNGYLGDLGGRQDNAADVDHYRFELSAGATLSVDVTPHSATLNLKVQLLDADDVEIASIVTGPGTVGTLGFNVAADGDYYLAISSEDGSTGSYFVDASVSGNAVSTNDVNSTFGSATPLGTLGAAGLTLTAQIERQTAVPLPPRAGGLDEPGHRQIQREVHIGATGTTPTTPAPIQTIPYYFPAAFSSSIPGETFLNQITEEEKRIVRVIFDIFASHSGYQFVETESFGRRIGKTDLRAFDPDIGADSGVAGLGGGGGAIVNAALFQDSNRFYGDVFTTVMFHEIGHSIGLGHAYELPALMGAGLPNDVIPGDHDIVHLQRIVPPNSTDIDMYRFTLAESGALTAETIAQRLPTPSLLNTVLTLYRETETGGHELVARNDRYFGTDSFLDLDLQPGTYFIGVSSTGNDNYDPNVPNSGFDGTTDGAYQLRLAFRADRGGALRDADGTAIDGDTDGRPGGVHSFWFQSSDVDTTVFVDRLNDPLITTSSTGGSGTIDDPFHRLSDGLSLAGSRIVVPLSAADQITNGETFVINDGVATQTFTFGVAGSNPIDISGLTDPNAIATAIATVINGSSLSTVATANGRVVSLTNLDSLDVSGTVALVNAPNLVRIVGNGGQDGDITTPEDNVPYLLGIDTSGNPLRDGKDFQVPQGVTVMVDAGTLIKARRANLDVGSSSVNVSRAAGAIQVLGTPLAPVWMRSYHDDSVGGNSDGVGPAPQAGDFGGIVFRGDSDLADEAIFLNHVTHANIRHGGGRVAVDSVESVFAPIHLVDTRPTIRFNHIVGNADSAISANPDSFDDSLGRIGPDIVGNFLSENTVDGLFIRIRSESGQPLERLNLPGRFANTDITHVLAENLVIAGNPGGPLVAGGGLVARAAGRLVIDPGVVLKVSGARIEAERGASAVIAEGTPNRPIIITSLADDRYGGSGAFDTNADGSSVGAAGDWAGIYLGHLSSGSIDNALLAFGGGDSAVEGVATNFNLIEVHQADLRITNSLIRENDNGASAGVRNGRGANAAATIYARGSQPVIVGNTFVDNAGPVASLNANSLNFRSLVDYGRSTGTADVFSQFADNHGPLIRLNSLSGNSINGVVIRGEQLTTESIWDDTDIVHVLNSEIVVDNHHTYSGLRLQSSNSESLVVKLSGAAAGFTATGTPLDIVDRIGGTVQVLGRPGFPVVMTHLADDSVGAGFAPDGTPMTNTNNTASPSTGVSGGWRGLRFDEWSNDRNVAIVRENENPLTSGRDINSTIGTAQSLGTLAPDQKSGDENRRLGFEVHGFISLDDPGDVDVYSFRGTAGTPIWIDIDRTDPTLDVIVEVLNASGTVQARSVRSSDLGFNGNLNVLPLTQNPLLGGDFYTQNFRDAGLYYVLPGVTGNPGNYFIRVRSNPQTTPISSLDGKSTGKYQLQIRLQQVDEFPGSTVRYADIRHAQTAIDVRGLPARSLLVGEAGELAGNTFDGAQPLTNLLETDLAAISISGSLAGATDVDWFRFEVEHVGVQEIAGVNDDPGTVAVVFDIDYADGLTRPDSTVAVYDGDGKLIWIGRESNIEDDRPINPQGSLDDLSRGSVGSKDPYIGPVHVIPNGTYYVAVMSNQQLPTELTAFYNATPTSTNLGLARLEPVNTVRRVVEDHIGFSGYNSHGANVAPETQRIFDISSAAALANHVTPFRLEDVVTYVATDPAGNDGDHLYTVNPYSSENFLTRVTSGNGWIAGNNDIQDIAIRTDGMMFGYQRLPDNSGSAGALLRIDPADGEVLSTGLDQIRGHAPTPNIDVFANDVTNRHYQFTVASEVDALAFHRVPRGGYTLGNKPDYDIYYSVRESDGSSKLYRARENGSAAPAPAAGGLPRYGYIGHIQPNGVTIPVNTAMAFRNADNEVVARVRLDSKIPGGGFGLTITRNDAPTQVTAVNLADRTATINLAENATTGVGAIVDLVNTHATIRRFLQAVIIQGAANTTHAATTPIMGTYAGLVGPSATPLNGRVTGLAMSNFSMGTLYGVTSGGQFISIDTNNGNATVLRTVAGVNFQGLTLGPQNVEGGAYANTLFAVTANGQLYAFDTSGNPRPIFENGDFSIQVGGTLPAVGIAFSPLDFNLWHPTMKRGNDAGHGINPAPDDSRAPGDVDVTIGSPGPGPNRTTTQQAGGASLHFGFEQWVQNPNADSTSYLTYPGANAQFGIRNTAQHSDLSSNAAIVNTYNFPGGALGSLVSDSFSLDGSVSQDRPTLYFNYFLDTESHPGSNVDSDVNDPFRDSARVFASTDGGNNWELVATNNSRLSGADPTDGTQRAELPGFLSHLSDAGSNSGTPRSQAQQIVQELMDSTGQWRQARVDLSTYAGRSNVMLRFDFSTAGAMRDNSLGLTEASFGEFTSGSTPRSIRSTNNAFEGFYIDDIIVGYAERGEMVTGGFTPERTVTDLAAVGARTRDNDLERRPNNLAGPYQLEIRRVDDVGLWVEGDGVRINQTFFTNDRHINTVGVTAEMGFEADETFDTSLPPVYALRDLIDVLVPGNSIPDDDLPDTFEPWAPEIAPAIDPITGAQSLASPATYGVIPDSMPPAQRVAAIYQTTPTALGAVGGRGVIRFKYSVSSLEDVHGLMFLVDNQPQLLIPPVSSETSSNPGSVLASGERRDLVVEFPFVDQNATLTWVYLFADQQGAATGQNRAWIDDIQILQGDRSTGREADRNRPRQQGMFIVEANTITDSSLRGINVQPGTAEASGSVPHPGSTINFAQRDQNRLVPGVVIQNNIIAGSSAIRFAGETTNAPQRPVPFGRLVNNTLVGAGGGVGIQIDGIASPTVMNNVITQFATGIGGATGLSVIRSNYFQANNANGPVGSDAIVAAAGTPLFVDAANGNYYLVSGNPAVDSSLNTLQDRFDYVNFKNPLGIPPSQIDAPDRDVYGQLRVDSGQSPGGGGSSVFKDRGAVDRADTEAPFAVLLDPIDNDNAGIDRDPNLTVVSLPDPIVDAFSILLTDGPGPNAPFQGTGVDPLTVSRDVVTIRRNNQTLTEGVDFTLGFNTATGEMRLTPLSALWEPAGVYEITLDNEAITDRAGNRLRANQPDGSTRFWIILPAVGLDFGDAPNSFGTLLASNGARHALIDGAMPRLGRYVDAESDGVVPPASDDAPASVSVFSPSDSALFQILAVAGGGVSVEVDGAIAVAAGDSLSVDIGDGPRTFELVPAGVAPIAGNVAVRFVVGDSAEVLANKLVAAIVADLAAPGDAFSVTIDPDTPATFEIVNLDDEDGVGVSTLTHLATDYAIFVRPEETDYPQYPDATSDNTQVLGFLNPLEPAGSQIAITVQGSGFIDAWVDFDHNGVFDASSERVLDSVAVVDGLNILTIHTPASTAAGIGRWLRVRLSPEGGLQPTGLGVGGEVEDYQVDIIRVEPVQPVDAIYTVTEDGLIDSVAQSLDPVTAGDSFPTNLFTPPYVVVVNGPQNAARFELDPDTGHFEYEPLADFAGIDVFTYYVALQQSAIDADISVTQPAIATVTIDVRPVNDAPLAASQGFITLESQPTPGGRGPHPLVITASDLLFNARAHQNPQYPVGAPADPWDETDQSLRVVEIILPDGTIVTADDAIDPGAPGVVHVTTVQGTAVIRFVSVDDPTAAFVDSLGSFIDMTYVSNDYLNRDNVTLQSVVVAGSAVEVFDFVHYTIEDDGLLIDPETIDPNDPLAIIENDTFFAGPFDPLDPTNRHNRLRHTSIAVIDVAPQNDHPIASATSENLVSIGPVGSGILLADDTFGSIVTTTPWSLFHKPVVATLDAAVDNTVLTLLVIETATLPATPFDIRVNDEVMTVTAVDELNGEWTVQRGVNGTTIVDHLAGDNIRLDLAVPVPTEDSELFIPAQFLLQSDLVGQVISTDESSGLNDGDLRIIQVDMVTVPASGGGSVVLEEDEDGNVQYVRFMAPTDWYGEVVFTYIVQDTGIDEDVDGNRIEFPLTATGTVTVVVQPVNDNPIAYDRNLEFTESGDSGRDLFEITLEHFLAGTVGTPAIPGPENDALDDSFQEIGQSLRVVRFQDVRFENFDSYVVDVTDLEDYTGPGTGSGTLTLPADLALPDDPRSYFQFDIENGALTRARFFPEADYNERSPFNPFELLRFWIEDDGHTTDPQGGAPISLPAARSVNPATLTITVAQTNDAPIYDFEPLVNILERDDSGVTVVANWATNILPGPVTALDELLRQDVSFSFVVGDSSVPTGLFLNDPEVSPDGTLSLFPAPDAVGTAIIVMRATDSEELPGFVARSTDATFTVNVQPVNDAPSRDADQFGTSDSLDGDTGWQITSNGTIVYTLLENNIQPGGVIGADYFIPLTSLDVIDAYNQIGLLDVFIVGPPNEADGTPGGSQTLSLNSFPMVTQRGGLLTLTTVDGRPGLNYRPPVNFNFDNGGLDSFTYSVIDDGQTYVLGASPFVDGTLVDDFLTATGRVELRLNAVNNRPEFSLPATYLEVAEDTDQVSVAAFAVNIAAGPSTAPDELTGPNAQTVSFVVNALSFIQGGPDDPFGAGYPEITPFGELTFRPLPDEFGSFEFEVLLVDSGADNPDRGDLNTSLPVTITIQVQPVNDPPTLVPNPVPLQYEMLEDHSIDLPLAGLEIELGLLDNFVVGPPNEAADISPELGGNQTLELIVPFPPVTAQNGVLVPIYDADGNLTHLRYTPRLHFVGIDTFTFTAVDNGVTVDVETGGESRPDPLSINGSVTINVLPVNDAPLFARGENVDSNEDQGVVTIANWATAIQAGPVGANDERTGVITGLPSVAPQTMEFIITQVLTEGDTVFSPLFLSPPVATIVGNNANLSYQTAPDANGTAVFTVILRDSGPNDPVRGDVNSTEPKTFTITVGAVNDPPQFTAGPVITIDEVFDDGVVFSFPWAEDVLPGPATAIDEIATQTVAFEVTTPADRVALFEVDGLPAIDPDGVLTFTPARFAAGQAVVQVVAVDSDGGRSTPISLTINITDINNVPIANDMTFEGDEDNLLRIIPDDLFAIAFDPDLISNPDEFLTLTDLPLFSLAGAAISFDAEGRLVYDPRNAETLQALAPGQTYVDTFTYRLVDAAGEISNAATITVNVAGINDAPTVRPDTAVAVSGQLVVLDPLENDFDIDGTIDRSSIFITRQPAFGVLVVRNDGFLDYTPSAAFIGIDVIGYTVADNLGQQSVQTTITIGVDRASQGQDLLVGTHGDGPVVIDAAGGVTPSVTPLDLSSIEIVTPPQNGELTISDDGQITYQANGDFFGTDSFQYRIFDIDGRPSNVITVPVQIVESPAQNPLMFNDVNADGLVEPLDALLILTRLAQAQRDGVVGPLTAEMVVDDMPMRYYDVDGNNRIEPLDALRVLTQIARANRPGGEGESVLFAPPIIAGGFTDTPPSMLQTAPPAAPIDWVGPVQPKAAAFDWDADDYDLIAASVAENREVQQADSSDLELADAVWGNLF